MEHDNETIREITVSNLDSADAKQLIIDLGFYPDYFSHENLSMSIEYNSTLFIGEGKAVALRNTSKFPTLYNNQEYFIVNIIFSENRVQDFIDGQISDINGESDYNEIADDSNILLTDNDSAHETQAIPFQGENALRAAEDYLYVMPFSQIGLYEQLLYEQYPEDAAQYAVENVKTDWFDNALRDAESYMEIIPMSLGGLFDQLLYEGYTPEEAQYAIDNIN